MVKPVFETKTYKSYKEEKMIKARKLNLNEIDVKSFVTLLDKDVQENVKGGSGEGNPGGTSTPIFCK